MSDFLGKFPDILPLEEIRVEDEEHTYEVDEDLDGNTIEKQQYTLNKAPFIELEGITGTVDGESYVFDRGTDFTVEDVNNDGRDDTIDFSVGGEKPDDNSTFFVTYIARSVVLRYLQSYEDEFHRFRDDVDEAIGSHYVGEASESGFIDNFEDEELVEYEFQAGTDQNAFVQTGVSFQGDWALRMQSPSAGNPVRIVSTGGLERYPSRGDTLEFYFKFNNADDIVTFDFMYTESSAGARRYYRVVADASSDEFKLTKQPNGAVSDTASFTSGQHQGDWVRVEIEIDPINDIVARLFDNAGGKLATSTIIDNEYDSGGIRWQASNPNGTSDVYIDAADIIGRRSGDLDRVGAIFGELGKRRGRDDEEYETFLRSIVQSFSGRGTLDGIKFSVASALDIDPEQVIIVEDFQNNSYAVTLEEPFPSHQIRTLTELADLADPSGVEFGSIVYELSEETVGMDDSVSFSTGASVEDQMGADDVASARFNDASISEEVSVDDAVATSTANVNWNETDWNDFDWATEHN